MEDMKNHSWWILLDPQMLYHPGVGMALITESDILGNHVTIATTAASLQPFFDIWRPLGESKNMSLGD